MLPELSEIKHKRKLFGLTQAGLAQKAGVSQSMVAKMEAGIMVPSYGNAKRIFDMLDAMNRETKLKAGDVMTVKVTSIRPEDTIKRAVQVMKKNAVSQLPVMDGGNVVGTVSEMFILSRIGRGERTVDVGEMEVREIMDEAMPVIRENSPLEVVSALLEFNQAVLVGKRGKISGIVTKSDLLGAMISEGRGAKGV
ncbi:MAG: CBS domain-containing protein [Candidatus Diapherotrites archaeon]|nr:CBS domain-containing protein [Candidatus Micrarchaeota archaeon]MBU1939917.1 CBS domain-containing protein [Candidatus Micrarchaeota archaeon]